ncbi:V-type ATP synthase subunit D [Candidatus Pacearchaeota archaeon]|nr:MAG: V-type ATP synthase subunit D [Candidatus Pacearchaeota archaeon]
MKRLDVKPNRMELLRLKKRRAVAQRGYDLLQDKLEKLMTEFHKLLRKSKKLFKEFDEKWNLFLEEFWILRSKVSNKEFEDMLKLVKYPSVDVQFVRIVNLKIPIFKISEIEKVKYSFIDFDAQWDKVLRLREDILRLLLDLATIFNQAELMAKEMVSTRRRVNTLEYVLIPALDETIKYITEKLSDMEREFITRLMKIKDLLERRRQVSS